MRGWPGGLRHLSSHQKVSGSSLAMIWAYSLPWEYHSKYIKRDGGCKIVVVLLVMYAVWIRRHRYSSGFLKTVKLSYPFSFGGLRNRDLLDFVEVVVESYVACDDLDGCTFLASPVIEWHGPLIFLICGMLLFSVSMLCLAILERCCSRA